MIPLFTTCVKYSRPGYGVDEYELIADSCERSESDATKYAIALKNMLISLGCTVVETILKPTRYVPVSYYAKVED